MRIASTREIIEKLEAYEKEHGIGAVVSIGSICSLDEDAGIFSFNIVNDSDYNRMVDEDNYKETTIQISSIDDDELFERKKSRRNKL